MLVDQILRELWQLAHPIQHRTTDALISTDVEVQHNLKQQTFVCFSCRYRNSLTAKASNAAWKNETVCNHCSHDATLSLLISKPVKSKLKVKPKLEHDTQYHCACTYLNSMTSVPTKLATLMLSNAIDRRSTTLAVVRLKRTSVSRNFQNAATVGTSPTKP